MRIKTTVLTVLALVMISGLAFAQRVPLVLDQTITLPRASDVWDVMPHPDGYYVWVEATEFDTEQTRIFWGRSDFGNVDSIDLDVGSPQKVVCFWRGEYEPTVVLASRHVFPGYPTGTFDSTLIRIYRLSDGLADSSFWLWRGWGDSSPNQVRWDYDYRIESAGLLPGPPWVSAQMSLLVSHYSYSNSWGQGYGASSSQRYAICIPDLLRVPQCRAVSVPGWCAATAWAPFGDNIAFAYFGSQHSDFMLPGGGGYSTTASGLQNLTVSRDSAAVPIPLWSCEHSDVQSSCVASPVAITRNSITNDSYTFARLDTACGCVSELSPGTLLWTVPGPYLWWLAADCVPGNTAEEFLCYSGSRNTFDVFAAADGQSYGNTYGVTIPTDGGARVLGRYDSTSRRLVFRDGQELKLYRFGQLEGAEEQNIPLPEEMKLAAYPNPFNPSTRITFSLARAGVAKVRVFDVTGRDVVTLVDSRLEAGEHSVNFDGSRLGSGIYFARLEAGGMARTEKMVMVK